jgi:regulator of sigma E protease
MLTAIVFIIILGILIFVHELGHFLVARRNGIKAEEFGFGFPPRAIGLFKDKQKKWRFIFGKRDTDKEWGDGGTIYSLNWLPLGGFVKIKGEDGSGKNEPDSFASKSAWKRIKVLAAGVLMNFVLAWFLISVVMMIGAPEEANETNRTNSKIQIAEVVVGTPAEKAGLKIGDEIARNQISSTGEKVKLNSLEETQKYIDSQRGKEIIVNIARGKEILHLKVTPREENPAGQGPLGISMVETAVVSYSWHQAIWKGLLSVFNLIVLMLTAFGNIIYSLVFGKGVPAEISGPVGIAVLTKQVTTLGLVYVLQFAAVLSINLGIINALPIPALDGGRILFILIEKIKGKPVGQKVEQMFHTVGFILLLALMALVTFRDVWKIVK